MTLRTLIVLALIFAATAGAAAAPDVAFETIPLKHVLACEIAPLLGPQFEYAADLSGRGTSAKSARQKSFPGIDLITAAHPASRYLLAAGTAHGVAELRSMVSALDVPQARVQIAAEVYPAPPASLNGWSEAAPVSTGLRVSTRALRPGEKLTFPALPPGYQPHQITVTAQQGRAEFVALPPFSNWPQVLLAVAREVESKGIVRVGVGVLDQSAYPGAAVREAWQLRNTHRLRSGQKLGLVISRGNSAITVILATKPGKS